MTVLLLTVPTVPAIPSTHSRSCHCQWYLLVLNIRLHLNLRKARNDTSTTLLDHASKYTANQTTSSEARLMDRQGARKRLEEGRIENEELKALLEKGVPVLRTRLLTFRQLFVDQGSSMRAGNDRRSRRLLWETYFEGENLPSLPPSRPPPDDISAFDLEGLGDRFSHCLCHLPPLRTTSPPLGSRLPHRLYSTK